MAGLLYIMEFKNVEDTLVKVVIGDNNVAETDQPIIKYLLPAGSPLRISTIDESEGKWTPVKPQQATITFHSNNDADLETFADGPDDRFPVTIYYGSQIIFKGFLVLDDNKEDFLPKKNEVVLTASDKLGALGETPLTDFDGLNPQGKYKIGQLVQMCLQKTGLELRLNVMHNLKHGSGSRTMLATFLTSTTPDVIVVSNANGSFFYPGQVLSVSGTVSNNGTFHVTDIGQGIVSLIATEEPLTFENEVSAIFTDITSSAHFFEQYLDAKTFESEIGVSTNCREVLEKILGYDCFLTQYKGRWWIMRVDEFDDFGMYVAEYDENGLYQSIYEETSLNKTIGFVQTHWFQGEATSVSPTRPISFVKLTYNFENPLEIVCNQDFERGDFTADLAPEQIDGITYSVKRYELDCWTNGQFRNNTPDPVAPSSGDYYIKRLFTDDYEKLRYVVLSTTSETGPYRFIQSQPIRLSVRDKGSVSVDFKLNPISSDDFVNILGLIFFGDSGTSYITGAGTNGTWVVNPNPFPSTTTATNSLWVGSYNFTSDEEKESFQTMSFSFGPVPERGDLYIYIGSVHNNDHEIYVNNLQFEYQPFTNGSYRIYRGRYHKVSRDQDGYLAKIEDEVFISDAERELFKGALFYQSDSTFFLTRQWYPAHRYALGAPTDNSFIKPFGEHQAFAVWNQNRLANRIFQYQFQGLGSDIPSLVHKFSISDVSTHSINRKFLMLTCDKDLFLCEVRGTLEQVFHTVEGKDFDSPHEFKYIT